MRIPERQDRRVMAERPLMRYLLSALVLSVVFFVIVKFMDKLYDDAARFQFELKAERLKASVNFVHQSWISKGRPSRMRLKFQLGPNESERLLVFVNASGWPINVADEDRRIDCQNIWRYLAEDLSKDSRKNQGSKARSQAYDNGCQFYRVGADGQRHRVFYDLKLGKITGPNKN